MSNNNNNEEVLEHPAPPHQHMPPPHGHPWQINDHILFPRWENGHGRFCYYPARVVQVEERHQVEAVVLEEAAGQPLVSRPWENDVVGFAQKEDADEQSNNNQPTSRRHQPCTVVLTFEYIDFPGDEEYSTVSSHDIKYQMILPRNDLNLLRVEHMDDEGLPEMVQRASTESPDTLIRWLKIAVEHRNFAVFLQLTSDPQFQNLPYTALGHEFLRLALLPPNIPVVRPFWWDNGRSSRAWAEDMDQLITWICDLCDVDLASFSVEAAMAGSGLVGTENTPSSSTWEHIAAQRNDVKLLVWLLQYRNHMFRKHHDKNQVDEAGLDPFNVLRFRQCDSLGRTPLHYAVLHDSLLILEAYREMEVQDGAYGTKMYFQSLADFHAKDAEGRTALEMTSDIENDDSREAMNKELQKLLRQIHQRILDRALAPGRRDEFGVFSNRDATEKIDFDYLAGIVAKYDLDLSGHRRENMLENVFYAAKNGELDKLKWLVETMKVVELGKIDPLINGHSLLQVAARWIESVRFSMAAPAHDNGAEEPHKVRLIEDWNGITPMLQYVRECCAERTAFLEFKNSWPEKILDRCGDPLQEERLALVVLWLIGKGVALPEGEFIVHECRLVPAMTLLKHRLDIYGMIKDWFYDRVPQAMTLVNEFLLGEKDAGNASPQCLALLCVQRPKFDIRNEGELTRLVKLQSILHHGDVDPSSLRDSEGRTILHLAVLSDHCLIAAWLSVNFRSLVFTRSSKGKLPLHIALEEGASRHICITMLRFTSDCQPSQVGYKADERVFELADQDGKTARDYALCCKHLSIRKIARDLFWPKYQSELIAMIANERTKAVDLIRFTQKYELEDYLRCIYDWFPVLHAAIGFGRADVLVWLDLALFPDSRPLPGRLAENKPIRMPLLPIVCHPGIVPGVGDLLEVRCCFRKHSDLVVLENGQEVSPGILDGTWKVEVCMPFDDFSMTMLVYDLRGTCDAVGMKECTFVLCHDGTVEASFGGLEKWISSAAIASPGIVRLELMRQSEGCPAPGGCVYKNDDRKLVMTKISAIDTESVPYEWRMGIVQEATDTELKIEYSPKLNSISQCRLTKAYSEVIACDSVRINTSGILKRRYTTFSMEKIQCYNNEEQNMFVSGKEFAGRCGQLDILKWIEEAENIAAIKTQLQDLETMFVETFLSDVVDAELESRIRSARQILMDSGLPSEDVEELEASFYVLDRCWQNQPPLTCCRILCEEKFQGLSSDRRLIMLAASTGNHSRLNWMMQTRRVGSNSHHFRRALMCAAQYDHLDTFKTILSIIDARDGDLGLMSLRVLQGEEETEMLAITVAVQSLSGRVALYLLQNNPVPEAHLTESLVDDCLRLRFARNSVEAQEKARYRAEILKYLFLGGAQAHMDTMQLFLETLRYVEQGEKNDTCVPLTIAVLQVLCEHGGDIVSVFQSYKWVYDGNVPLWLTNHIEKIEADEKVLSAFLNHGSKSDNTDDSIPKKIKPGDLTAMRDRRGRSLLELAAMAENRVLIEYLIKFTALNFDLAPARKLCGLLGLDDMVSFLDSLEHQRNKLDAQVL